MSIEILLHRGLMLGNHLVFDGLRDRPRSGRKPDLTKIEQKVAIKLIKKYPRSLKACCRKIG